MNQFQTYPRLLQGVFVAILLFAAPVVGVAEDTSELSVSDQNAMKLSLEHFVGKVISLRMTNGEDISGTVEAVGPTNIRVGKLTGREFYSAVIRIDDIIAVIFRSK